jgi:hypothetical protein
MSCTTSCRRNTTHGQSNNWLCTKCDFQSATDSLALVRVVHLEISKIQFESTETPSELNILLAAKQIIFRALADFDTPTMHTTVKQKNGLLDLSPLTISLHTSVACAPMHQQFEKAVALP